MNKKIYIRISILFFIGAVVGYYFAENIYHSLKFVIWAVIVPMILGGISFCIYMDKRKKPPH